LERLARRKKKEHLYGRSGENDGPGGHSAQDRKPREEDYQAAPRAAGKKGADFRPGTNSSSKALSICAIARPANKTVSVHVHPLPRPVGRLGIGRGALFNVFCYARTIWPGDLVVKRGRT